MLEKASLDICKEEIGLDYIAFQAERGGGSLMFFQVFHYLACFLHGFFVFIFKAGQHFGLENAGEPEERQEAHDYQG